MIENYYTCYLQSPVGNLKLYSDSHCLLSLTFVEQIDNSSSAIPSVLTDSVKQLNEYFEGNRKVFNLPLKPLGTDFQKQIWNFVQNIKYGKTASYLDIAKLSGSIKNTRAVGLANGKNPIPIIIPCHRIIGTNGKLTGYVGGLERKKWLLLHEASQTKKNELLF